jgi:hypothetical protein
MLSRARLEPAPQRERAAGGDARQDQQREQQLEEGRAGGTVESHGVMVSPRAGHSHDGLGRVQSSPYSRIL